MASRPVCPTPAIEILGLRGGVLHLGGDVFLVLAVVDIELEFDLAGVAQRWLGPYHVDPALPGWPEAAPWPSDPRQETRILKTAQ
jgi:hypothetical protein